MTGVKGRVAMIGLTLSSLFIGYQTTSAMPNVIPVTGGNHTCLMYAQTTNSSNPIPDATIYDDGSGNYYFPTGWTNFNCGNHFLIREYVNTDINIGFNYEDIIDPSLASPPVTAHNIVIKNLTTTSVPTVTASGWTDINPDGSFHFYVFHPTVQGIYQIEYFRPGATVPDITGRIAIIRKITSLGLTLPAVCPGSTTQYNFNVTSTPSFSSLLYGSNAWAAQSELQ